MSSDRGEPSPGPDGARQRLFDEAHQRHHHHLVHRLRRWGLQREVAEEIVQEAWLQAFRAASLDVTRELCPYVWSTAQRRAAR
ncbi:hypothetical protein ACSNOK_33920, partial [Streptomyces sp. URMC 126]|uniref:hypothetical protein n=1 Tax=Streptomyces sp. URMC 126 TaxID=3423401 RepID=UPI003F19B830